MYMYPDLFKNPYKQTLKEGKKEEREVRDINIMDCLFIYFLK